MRDTLRELSRHRVARLAGLLYVTYIVIFAVSAFLQGKPIVWTDAPATAKAISASPGMFRAGVSLELLAALLFLLTAWSLYVLFKPAGENLALLFLLLNAAGVSIECVAALIHFSAFSLANGSGYLTAFRPDQLQSMALFFLQLSANGNMVTVLFYAAWLFPLGYLAMRSRLLPKVFGVLLIVDAISLMLCFFQLWFLPGYQKWTYPLYPVMFVAEFGFGLWLAIKGIKNSQPSVSVGTVEASNA